MDNEKALQIFNHNGTGVIDSREVARYVDKDHKNLVRDIRSYLDYMRGELNFELSDFFIESTYVSEQNKRLPCYLVTRKGCEMVANKLTGQKGVLFTAAYVERFHQYEQALMEQRLPRDYLSALKALVASEEEKLLLQGKIEADAPLVQFANHVSDTTDLIDVGQMAKIARDEHIKIGRNKLFDWLRDNGYLRHNNEPYQRYIDMGLFEVREVTKDTPYGGKVFCKTYVTGKGQIHIIEKLREAFGVETAV